MSFRILISVCLFLTVFIHSADIISPNLAKKINENVFELVIKKEEFEKYRYEKELPFDLLPYSRRNDNFIPLGSCFLLADNKFITAAHVLALFSDHKIKDYYIRTSDKKVYKINQITKYSHYRDFAVFTVEEGHFKSTLGVEMNPELNELVIAVGNALGEGIVTRTGLLTSFTDESLHGKWKWLRFSAAASPGNSGGPLLDKKGNILGVVLQKSQNENLNYALPITEVVDFSEHDAEVYSKLIIRVDILRNHITRFFNQHFQLPKEPEVLKSEIYTAFRKKYYKYISELKDSYGDDQFLKGENSKLLINRVSYDAFYPKIVSETENKLWMVYSPQDLSRQYLDHKSEIIVGNYSEQLKVAYLLKPENKTIPEIINNSQVLSSYLLNTGVLKRSIAGVNTRVTDIGDADHQSQFLDSLGRTWFIYKWDILFSREKLILMALPTPESITMYYYLVDAAMDIAEYDLQLIADYVVQDYQGSLESWDVYFKQPYRARFLQDIVLNYSTENVSIKTDLVDLEYTDRFYDLDKENRLGLTYTYTRDKSGYVDYKLREILFSDEKEGKSYSSISKVIEPQDDLPRDIHETWENITKNKPPYNGQPFYYEGNTYLLEKFRPEFNKDYRYVLRIVESGQVSLGEIKKSRKYFRRSIRFLED